MRMTRFQSRTCLKKDASVLFVEWPEEQFFLPHDQEKQENNQNHGMPKRMVVGVCWQAWQSYCGGAAASCEVRKKRLYEKSGRHV